MKPLMVLGLILVLAGALILGYQGFTYVTQDKIIDVGPVQVTAERQHAVWIPPVIGGVAVVAGVICMAFGAAGRRSSSS
jgi:drug/metabolite transporter (DMT)-like permease